MSEPHDRERTDPGERGDPRERLDRAESGGVDRTRSGPNRGVTSAGTEPTDEEILAHARVHARSVADEIGVDLEALEWEVSPRAKRRAGACRWHADSETATIVLSRRAYRSFDREAFEAVVRHELLHAWEFQTFGESDHGPRFRERAEAFDVSVRCESFTEPRYVLGCLATDCEWELERHRASRPVRNPERYCCGDCGADLVVEHVESARTWRSAAGFGGAKSALGEEW